MSNGSLALLLARFRAPICGVEGAGATNRFPEADTSPPPDFFALPGAADAVEVLEAFEATDTELMSEPEPNSLSLSALIPRVSFFSFPMRLFFFFLSVDPPTQSLCVERIESRLPTEARSTEESRSRRRMLRPSAAEPLL